MATTRYNGYAAVVFLWTGVLLVLILSLRVVFMNRQEGFDLCPPSPMGCGASGEELKAQLKNLGSLILGNLIVQSLAFLMLLAACFVYYDSCLQVASSYPFLFLLYALAATGLMLTLIIFGIIMNDSLSFLKKNAVSGTWVFTRKLGPIKAYAVFNLLLNFCALSISIFMEIKHGRFVPVKKF